MHSSGYGSPRSPLLEELLLDPLEEPELPDADPELEEPELLESELELELLEGNEELEPELLEGNSELELELLEGDEELESELDPEGSDEDVLMGMEAWGNWRRREAGPVTGGDRGWLFQIVGATH